MTSYPSISFRREVYEEPEASRWGAYRDGRYLGSVARMPLGYWAQVGGASGYATRYEAAYSLLSQGDPR